MNNDKCKICNLTITNYDTVKVCPECGECYHKLCYEEHGCVCCTTTIKNESNERICATCKQIVPNDALFCPTCGMKIEDKKNLCKNCGKEIKNGVNFCSFCGATVLNNLDNSIKEDEIKRRELNEFIGNNCEKYREKFYKMENGIKRVTFNWCSFLFGSFWFAYRKLYLYAAIYIAINLSLQWLTSYNYIKTTFSNLVSFGLWFLSGFLGDLLYMRYVNKHLKKSEQFDDDQKFYYYKRKGGTSILSIFIVLIIAGIIGTVLL